jgi:hypothetical protein
MQSCACLSNALQARSVTRLVLLRRPPLPRRLTSVHVHTEANDPCPLLEFDIVAVVAAVSTNAHAMPSRTIGAQPRGRAC